MDEEGACIGEEAEEVVAQADKKIAQPSAFDSQAVRDLFGDAAFQNDSEAFDFASSDGSISLDGVSPAREQSRKTVSKNLDAFFPSVKALPAGTTWAKARKLDDIMMATLLCAAFCSDRFWLGFAHWLAYTLVSVKGSLLVVSTSTNYFGTAMSIANALVLSDTHKGFSSNAQKAWLKAARESGRSGFLSKVCWKLSKIINTKRRLMGMKVR